MATLTIKTEGMEEVKKYLDALGKDAPKAQMRAINKTLTGARTDMTSEIYNHFNITSKRIRDSFTITRANMVDLSAGVSTTGVPLNLADYDAKQTKKGVTVKILRQGGRKLFPQAFLATMKSGKVLVMSRVYKGAGLAAKPGRKYGILPEEYRLPIKALSGPRLQDCLEKPEVWATIKEKTGARLLKNMEHETDYLLSQQLEAGDGFSEMVE